MYCIYLLIDEFRKRSYVGFTDNISRRIIEHKKKQVNTTINFGNFEYSILEDGIKNRHEARTREKYWKSCAGRKKIKVILGPIV